MTRKEQFCGGLWLLIFLIVSPPVWGQTLERIEYPDDNETATSPEDIAARRKRPDYKIHFKLAPKSIDETRISQTLVWEYQDRRSKNAGHFYMRAHYYLTEKLNSQATQEYRYLLDHIWGQTENGDTVDLEFLNDLAFKPVTKQDRSILPEEELTEEERDQQRRDQFVGGVDQRRWDYALFSLKEHPEQLEAVRQFVQDNTWVFKNLEEGSRCDDCDFGIPFRETDAPIALLLPEIQNMRELVRALRVKIMLEIHEKRYEDAIASVRVGLCMARHTGKQPTLVTGLVGIAIQNIMFEQVQDMINSPDCPNLYWELSSLPYPFLNFIDAAEIEKQILPQTFPLLRKAMDAPESILDDEWRKLLRQMDEVLVQLTPSENDSLLKKLPIKSNVMASYPAARLWLATQGKTSAEVDAMIPEKVVGMHAAYDIRKIYGDAFRQVYLPLWEEYDSDEIIVQYHRELTDNPLSVNVFSRRLTSLLLPAMQAARTAYRRMLLSNDVMRIAEALRDYAARNGGQLPESLDAIKNVPIPMINPFTGKAYEYKLEDGVGKIEIPQMWKTVIIFEIVK